MNKLARNTLALGTATMIVTAGISFSANGADATKSYSAGRFLSGTLGGTNVDTIAQLRGVAAANPGNIGANKNNLDLTLLSAIPVKVPGGINLDVANLLSPNGAAGVISQYAAAPSKSKSVGASGAVSDSGAILTTNGSVPTGAKVDLSGNVIPGINPGLASVNIGLGALSSNTTVENGSPTTRAYQIAGVNLQASVPLLKTVVGSITTALAPVNAANNVTLSLATVCPLLTNATTVTIDALVAQLNQITAGVGDAIKLALDPLNTLGNSPINPCTVADLLAALPLPPVIPGLNTALDKLVAVKVTGLADVTNGLKSFSNGGVALDLANGTITLDLAEILKAAKVDINNLPANTDLLQYVTSDLISTKLTSVINSAITNLVTNLGKVDIEVTLAGTVVPVKLTTLTGQAVPALAGALTQASSAIGQLGAPIDNVLKDLVPNLNRIVKLTANNQSESKTPTLSTGTVGSASSKAGNISTAAVGDYYRTSALKIDLLTNVLNLDLAASEAATLAADVVSDDTIGNTDANADTPVNNDDNDSVADGTDANGDDSDTVADADAQADADVTTSLPSTGAPNLLPFWLLGIGLLLFGGAVLLNEKRRLNQI